MADKSENQHVGGQVARGAVWTISFRMVERLLGFASSVVLVRVLTPSDFGIVAMAITLLALLEILTMNDFGSAIIQNRDATRDHYDTAWTLNVLLGVVAGLVLLLVARPMSVYYNEPRLVAVVTALSVLPIVDGLFNMGCIDFRKHLQFRKDFQLQIGKKLIGLAFVVPLALMFRSYWALVAGTLAGRVGGLLLSFVLHPYRPRFSLKSARGLYNYSRWIVFNNALKAINDQGYRLVLGRLAGPTGLGAFVIAQEMANLPTSELAMPINRAVFPGYAKLRGDNSLLQYSFIRVIGVIALVAVPAGVGLAAVSPLFVAAVLGSQWLMATTVLSILALAGTVHVLQANIEPLYFALGYPRFRVIMTSVEVLLLLPCMYLLFKEFGIAGAAVAVLVTKLVVVPVNFGTALRLLGLGFGPLFRVLWRPTLGAGAMAVCATWLARQYDPSMSNWDAAVRLLVAVSSGALVYAVVVGGAWAAAGRPEGAERWLLSRVSAVAKRIGG